MDNIQKEAVNTESANLPEKEVEQGLVESHDHEESHEAQVDTLTTGEEHNGSINELVQETLNQTDTPDRILIRETMATYSVEDSLIPIETEKNISQYNNHKPDGKPYGTANIKWILERINGAGKKSRWEKREKEKHQNIVSVTWAAEFTGERKLENVKQYSGFTTIELGRLPSNRFMVLRSDLESDPFSCLVISNESAGDLTVVAKISANSTDEYTLVYQKLIDYYRRYYGVTKNDFVSTSADVCQLFDLTPDLKVHCNPSSRRLLNQKAVDEQPTALESQPTSTYNVVEDRLDQVTAKLAGVQTKQSKNNNQLAALLQTEKRISKAASHPIVFKPALVSRDGVPIIGHGTINVIQGKPGQHKSRLAELFASLLLANENCTTDFLGFERMLPAVTVCYIDTERNIDEEFANAVQSIRQKAGYAFNEEPENLRFTSLKQEKRSERLHAVDEFLEHVRQSTVQPLFIILDVVTDCLQSFNSDQHAMQLFDSLHRLCELYQATFLLVIHENPTNDKARGHVGTEAANKSSVRLQISVEDGKDTEPLIKLTYLKLRNDKKPESIHLRFDDQTKQLQLANQELIKAHATGSKSKINTDELINTVLQELANGSVPKGELVKVIRKQFDVSDKTVRLELKELIDEKVEMIDQDGQAMILAGSTKGREYILQPID